QAVDASNLVVQVGSFVSLTGNFSFSKTDTSSGGIIKTELAIAATNVYAFIGAGADTPDTSDDTGVRLTGLTPGTGANLGLLLFKTFDPALPVQAPSTYALVANGKVELAGITGLTLSG